MHLIKQERKKQTAVLEFEFSLSEFWPKIVSL